MGLLSIITVNYNNAAGFEKTIKSVIRQSADFEYIIIDGGSSDGSTEIIKKYEHDIDLWLSERDHGIYHAMNKGIQRATGDYLLFLNSGDTLYGASVIEEVQDFLQGVDIIYGGIQFIGRDKQFVYHYPAELTFNFLINGSLPHPSSFIKRELLIKLGTYDESLRICSDWRFFINAICKHNCSYKRIENLVSNFVLDGISSKTENTELISKERAKVLLEDFRFRMEDYNSLLEDNRSIKGLNSSRVFALFRKMGMFRYVNLHL